MYTFRVGWWVNFKAFCQTIFQKLWLDNHGILYTLRKSEGSYNQSMLQSQILESLAKYPWFIDLNQEYIVELTPYGVYGRYRLPNHITVNIQRKPNEIALTILHEVVHLRLESEVQKKKLTHSQKERMVEEEYCRLIIGKP